MFDLEIHSFKEQVDISRKDTIHRDIQRELFEAIDVLSTPSTYFKREDVVIERTLDEVYIRSRHNGFGNELFRLSLTGWEIAAILECMCPYPDNPLQIELQKRLKNSIGSLAGLFSELSEKHSASKRVSNFISKEA